MYYEMSWGETITQIIYLAMGLDLKEIFEPWTTVIFQKSY